MAAPAVTEIASDAELQALYKGHGGIVVVLLWAPWHPASVNLTKVLEALAAKHKTARFGKVNTDVCPAIASALGADQVPFVAFLDGRGRSVDKLAGADPPKLVQKVEALASRSFDVAAAPSREPTSAAAGGAEDLNARLKTLVNFDRVMLFMKGNKDEPFCKFSKQAVEILSKLDVEYSTFDILQDEEVRQGLKDYSNWKTYPQLYIDGELFGGVDIMKEGAEDGSLAKVLPSADAAADTLEDRLRKLINKAPVVLFMKGAPEQPQCGFSGKICGILNDHDIKFDHFNILSDEEVRQGLKTYSNWPTFPQLYANGKLIGGLDIVRELADEGSLMTELGLK